MINPLADIPPRARALTAIGDATAQAVLDMFRLGQASLFPPEDDPAFLDLADALRKQQWDDGQAAELIRAYGRAVSSGRTLALRSVTRWVLAHDPRTPASAIIECIDVDPPPEIEIIRVLSHKGSQKVVFLASWRLAQQEIVLKRIMGATDMVARVLERELQPHPLSMVHPNIIETHVLRNSRGESFLVERRLRVVLDDRWEAKGLHEAANLLYDMTKAIRFLHDHERVHGDIKPDNIGMRDNRYILLDFGICRPAAEFTPAMTPTGSLRTRPPELLTGEAQVDPYKVDIWALGATVFNSIVRRFPLIDHKEAVPRLSAPEERRGFEEELARRVRAEWGTRITTDSVQPPLRGILDAMLHRDPRVRPSAADLARRVEAELAAFLRSGAVMIGSSLSGFSPHEDFVQIADYLRDRRMIGLLPPQRRQQLLDRLRDLRGLPGFADADLEAIGELITDLNQA